LMSVGLFGAWNVSRGRTGRALLVIKDSEIAAGSLGIHAAQYKVIAFAISAFYASIAGGLFAYLVRYINPESFSVGLSISFLSMVVIGGLGTIGGSILGAAFYVIVPELLRGIKDAPGLVFGLLLVVVMVFMPQGLWGMLRRIWQRSAG
jgi:branched-chain amino acid transport system permease protein